MAHFRAMSQPQHPHSRPPDEAIEAAMIRLLAERGQGQSISPTDVARAIAGDHPDAWGKLMTPVRRVAVALAHAGRLVILRKGKPADPDDFKGVYRLAFPPAE